MYDPDSSMPYWGMAHAMGPNPNSRYARITGIGRNYLIALDYPLIFQA